MKGAREVTLRAFVQGQRGVPREAVALRRVRALPVTALTAESRDTPRRKDTDINNAIVLLAVTPLVRF